MWALLCYKWRMCSLGRAHPPLVTKSSHFHPSSGFPLWDMDIHIAAHQVEEPTCATHVSRGLDSLWVRPDEFGDAICRFCKDECSFRLCKGQPPVGQVHEQAFIGQTATGWSYRVLAVRQKKPLHERKQVEPQQSLSKSKSFAIVMFDPSTIVRLL